MFWLPFATLAGYAPFVHTLYAFPRWFILAVFGIAYSNSARLGVPGLIGCLLVAWAWVCGLNGADPASSVFGIYGTGNNSVAAMGGLLALYSGLSGAESDSLRERFLSGLGWGLAVSLAWSLGQLYGTPGLFTPTSLGQGVAASGRAIGLIGSPVYLGATLALSVPLLLGHGYRLAAICGIVGIVLTGTRGAYLGVAVGCFILYAIKYRHAYNKRGIIAVSTLCILFSIYGFREMRKKAHSDAGRLLVYEATWQGIKERPWIGWGPEGSYFIYRKYADERWKKVYGASSQDHAHNALLDAVATTGVIGGVLFLAVWLAGLYSVRGSPEAVAAFCGLAVCSMFNPVGMAAKLLLVSVAALWGRENRPIRFAVVAQVLAAFYFFAVMRTVYLERIASTPSDYLGSLRTRGAIDLRAIFPSQD